ncbi:MAG: TSUP family transporter, partial [Bradyrhizobium sp.]|nr:TSUP family transporter [Bradyrhizobium sp.]
VGIYLVLYSLYELFRPAIPPVKTASPVLDAGVGFFNGMLCGMTGLAGILVTIWCGLRGWPKDVQRTVFQPVAVITFLMGALWIGASSAITPDTVKLFLIGLPALFAGTWLGLKLYGRLDEAAFRKVVLVLLLASGAVLVV